ncbi:MAG: type II toxin-antitoxin system VapC family toxin [Solirubrobacteraceae bacterium]
MIVLDTTVLVYAKGAEHPLRDPCRGLLEAIAQGLIQATTTAEVIQELVHVRARRRGRADAAALGRDYADLLAPLLPVTVEELRSGLELYRQIEPLGAFDAVLAAVALSAPAPMLVSADRAFANVPRLVHVFPDRASIAALTAR